MTDTPSLSPTAQTTPAAQPAVAPAAASPQVAASTVGTSQTTAPAAPAAAPVVATRPEYVPEAHWDATANKVKDDAALTAHFNEIIARDAAEQSRRLALPQTPEAYKAELPTDFKPPDGIDYKFNDADPLLAQARTLAKELGIPQEGFSKLLGLYAGAQVATAQQIQTAKNAEIAKLGPTGPARVDAVTTVFKATLGEAEGQVLASRMFTAQDVQIAEKLVAKLTQQGNFRGTGREPPSQPGRVSEEQYAKMSPAQRLDYTRQFDQSQFQKSA